MALCRHRIFLYLITLLLLLLQPLIYILRLPNNNCKTQVEIIIPSNISDKASIINLHTKILCWIPTTLKRLQRANVVYETWAKRCDHSVFIIGGSQTSKSIDTSTYPFPIVYVGDENIEKYNKLSEKTLLSLLHIYQNYIKDYDWFFKGDDDTYVIIENLRHFLRRRPSNISFYYGYTAKTPDRFYASGGAGYVLSQQALIDFGKDILSDDKKRRSCTFDEAEDVNLAYCLARANVFVTNGLDDQRLERFHPMTFQEHFMGNFTRWIKKNAQFTQQKGEACCSPLTISFHGLSPDEIKMMHFLLYHIQKAPV